ncbi:hypothetical protein [Pantoea cypripedii]|uniref:hypothetical protein n=1 Tax=Pantoea cypripedii TaxID=55209 RepID=UPI0020C81066|nr:hypothetical protein [Pantoea cypripedii]
MRHNRNYTPHLLYLSSSVDVFGTNNPDAVKTIQRLIDNAGYHVATGRTLQVNRRCDTATVEAIRWYQLLLNMSPSGLIQPT